MIGDSPGIDSPSLNTDLRLTIFFVLIRDSEETGKDQGHA